MKKLLTIALTLGAVLAAQAAPVSPATARQTALTYVKAQPGASGSLSVKSAEKYADNLYLVNFAPQGWAIVGADDIANPIIGFSTTGSMSAQRMPENMAYMMQEASTVIGRALGKLPTDKRWKQIADGSFMRQSRAAGEPIEPLIKVNWNQGSPYNKYCPGEGKNKAVVGCVAVSMSQAMSVQRWPLSPQGQASYSASGYGVLSVNYDNEQPYDWDAILSGANDKDEVARLLYHAGVSVFMGYGADGSGIPSNQIYRISNALNNNFAYQGVKHEWRKSYTGDWAQLVLNELQAGRAVVYNAIDTKGGYGHSFNVDGYNGSNFHVNWGWGGYGNGYFSLDHLTDATMNMNYDSDHRVVYGIGAPNSPLRSVTMSDLEIETGLPAGASISALLINGEMPDDDFKVEVSGQFDGTSYAKVPVTYSNGLLRTTREVSASESPIAVRVKVTHKPSNTSISQGFIFNVVPTRTIAQKTRIAYDRASGVLTVHTKFDSSYVVRNAAGTEVAKGTLTSLPEINLNRSDLSAGTNTIEITSGSQSQTFKLKL